MKGLFLLLTFVFLTSCSSIIYQSKGGGSIPVSKSFSTSNKMEFQGVKKFYLWGLFPLEHRVDINSISKKKGFSHIGNISIFQYRGGLSLFLSFISFGMYTPLDYKIIGYGTKKKNNTTF